MEGLDAPDPDFPRHLHHPFLDSPTESAGLQNTDPFVFGDEFLYTSCQQWRRKPHAYPVQLRYLLPGSIVLFGSCSGDRFLLDTVFVVHDFIDHDRGDYRAVLRGTVPDAYWTVTLEPWYSGPADGRSFRLYRGANPANPVNGMFSFFPCRRADGRVTRGFPRPDLSGCGPLVRGFARVGPQRGSTTLPRLPMFGRRSGRRCWLRVASSESGRVSLRRIRYPSPREPESPKCAVRVVGGCADGLAGSIPLRTRPDPTARADQCSARDAHTNCSWCPHPASLPPGLRPRSPWP